jgi:uncharacterized membrane protein YedE/YeeE
MNYWPWWIGGFALASAMLLHWVLVRRMMGVSGRFTSLVDRARSGEAQEGDGEEMDAAALVAAMREATALQFGAGAVEEATALPADMAGLPALALAKPQPPSAHLVFLLGLVLGGLLSAALAGHVGVVAGLRSVSFVRLAHGFPGAGIVLLFTGGMLVGFGTRMAGGCTSGHGMCGVSRFQSGSLLATAAFFGTGVAASLLLGRLL